MEPDELSETPDDQLWAGLDHAEAAERARILEELGRRAFERGDLEESIALSETAAATFQECGQDRDAAQLLYGQAQGLLRLDRTDEAVQVYERAADLFRVVGDQTEIAHCLSRAGWALAYASRDEEALPRWESAQRLFAADGAREHAGRAAMARGESLGRLGQQSEALVAFRQAREHFRGAAPAPMVAWADDRAAAALIDLGRVGEALDMLRACLHVAEVAGQAEEHAYASYRLGWTLRIHHDYEEALTHLQKARDLYSDLQDLGGVARCDQEAAAALSRIGEEEQAEGLYVRARSVFDALGEDYNALMCDINRAVLYSDLDRLEDAIALSRRVLERCSTEDAQRLRHGLVSRLARDLVRAGRGAEAVELLEANADEPLGDEIHEQVLRVAARAQSLLAVGRSEAALDAAERGLDLAAGSDYPGLRADLFEVRGLAREDSDPAASLRDLGQAIALLLADGQLDRAAELSRRFLPRDHDSPVLRIDRFQLSAQAPPPPEPDPS